MKKAIYYIIFCLLLTTSVYAVTDNNGQTLTLSANAGGGGYIFLALNNLTGDMTITRYSGMNGDDWYLHESTGTNKGTLIASNTSNSNTNVTFYNVNIAEGDYFLVYVDGGGASYNRYLKTSCGMPIGGTNVNWSIGWHNGLGSTQDTCFNFVSITTNAVNATPSNDTTTVTLTYPTDRAVYQRYNSTHGYIYVEGNVDAGNPQLEISLDGATFQNFSADWSGTTFNGTWWNQVDQGELVVRVAANHSVNDSVQDVGIGDVFGIVGSSTCFESSGPTDNEASSPVYYSYVYSMSDQWEDGANYTDFVAGSAFSNAFWAYPMNGIVSNQSIPTAWVPYVISGATINSWQPQSANYQGFISNLGNATNGKMHIKAVFSCINVANLHSSNWQGYDITKEGLLNITDALFSQINMEKYLTAIPFRQVSTTDSIVNNATKLWSDIGIYENTNLTTTFAITDLNLNAGAGDGVHFLDPSVYNVVKERWLESALRELYGGNNNTIEVVSVSKVNDTRVDINVSRNSNLLPTSGINGFLISDGTNVYDDSNVTSVSVNGSIITLNLGYSMQVESTLTYGFLGDTTHSAPLYYNDTGENPAIPFYQQSILGSGPPSPVTDAHGETLTLSANSGGGGFIFTANKNLTDYVTITRYPGVNADDWDLYASNGTHKGVLLASNNSNGNTNITFYYQFNVSDSFIITGDFGGSSYNRYIKTSCGLPIAGDNVDFTIGWHDGLNVAQDTCFNILSITTTERISNDFFIVDVTDGWGGSNINNVTVTMQNGSTTQSFSNTTGNTVITTVGSFIGNVYNVTVSNANYFNTTYYNVDVSSSLSAELNASRIMFNLTDLTGNDIPQGNITIGAVTQNLSYLWGLSAGIYNVTGNSEGYNSRTQEVEILPLDEKIVTIENLTTSVLNLTAVYGLNGTSISIFNVTIIGNSNSYETTGVTTNGSLIFDLVNDTYTIYMDAVGYVSGVRNVTVSGNTSYEFELFRVGDLQIRILNITDGEEFSQNVTLKVQNSTTQVTYEIENGTGFLENLIYGTNYVLTFSSLGFATNVYNLAYDAESNSEIFTAYLAPNTTDTVIYRVTDSRDVNLENALVQVESFVNDTLVVVGSRLTDVTGATTFDIDTSVNARITIQKEGYTTAIHTLYAPLSDDVTFKLVEIAPVNYTNKLTNIFYDVEPKGSTIYPDVVNFSLNVTALDGDLVFFRVQLYNGTTLLNSSTSTNVSGGFLQIAYNISAFINSSVQLKVTFQKDGFDIFTDYYNYNVLEQGEDYGSFLATRSWAIDNLTIGTRFLLWVVLFVLGIIFIAYISYQLFNEPTKGIILLLPYAILTGWLVGISYLVLGFLSAIFILSILLSNRGGVY